MSRRRRGDSPFSLFAFQDIITAVTGILILITLLLALSIVDAPMNEAEQEIADLQALKARLVSLRSEVADLEDQLTTDNEIVRLVSKSGAANLVQLKSQLEQSLKIAQELLSNTNKQTHSNADSLKRRQDQVNAKTTGLQQTLANIEQLKRKLEEIRQSNRAVYQVKTTSQEKPWLLDLSSQRWLLAAANEQSTPVRIDQSTLAARVGALESWQQSNPGDRRYLVLLVRSDGVDSYKKIRESVTLANAIDFGVDLIADDITVIDPKTGAVID